jgi:hypothetical protein
LITIYSLSILILVFNLNANIGMELIIGRESKAINTLSDLADEKDIIPVIGRGTSIESFLKVRKSMTDLIHLLTI